MAGQQNYYEEPAEEGYYDEGEYAEGGSTGEDLSAIASVPWVAIALAIHVILITVFYFVKTTLPAASEQDTIVAQNEQISVPPEPETPPEEEVEHPKDEPVEVDPTEDPKIVEDAKDEVNEDNTNQPNEDLAENPNDNDSDNESPHPNKNSSNSSIGLGGGIGGGGGRGGAGGLAHRRARGGGGRPHDDRTKAALEWLKDHQNRAGHWSATTFSDDSVRKSAKKTYNIEFVDVGEEDGDKGWEQTTDIGLTGLSLLAFVGAGFDHTMGPFQNTCRNAILYLRRNQGQDGCFGPQEDDHFVYNHSICTMAMAEAYGLSGQAVLKPVADKAVDFILRAQNPGFGWRYGIQPGQNDSSVTGWMVLALKSCKMAGLEFDHTKCYDDAEKWYELVTIEVDGYKKVGYKSPGSDNARLRGAKGYDTNPSMDSIYVMSMLFMNKRTLQDKDIKELAKICVEKDFLPKWEQNRIDYYYWYYASLALYQVGGTIWKTWEGAMSKTLLDSQRGYHKMDTDKNLTNKSTLDEHGSWDSVDAWGAAGGRVYSTAINALTLEVYYRYLRQADQKKK
ncbi:MAG: prenyltransferase/squalene oxidase repeat-containing protein [Planctomycetota bacterium]